MTEPFYSPWGNLWILIEAKFNATNGQAMLTLKGPLLLTPTMGTASVNALQRQSAFAM